MITPIPTGGLAQEIGKKKRNERSPCLRAHNSINSYLTSRIRRTILISQSNFLSSLMFKKNPNQRPSDGSEINESDQQLQKVGGYCFSCKFMTSVYESGFYTVSYHIKALKIFMASFFSFYFLPSEEYEGGKDSIDNQFKSKRVS